MSLGKIAFQAIEKNREILEEASMKIWENPEGPFKEFIACEVSAKVLEDAGFNVEVGVAGVPTAIKATYGSGKPVIGFLGEYDALPGLSQSQAPFKESKGEKYGHGCGHNLLGVAHIAAVIGMKEEMEEKGLEGTIIYYGCPAEEILVGKGFMARGGAFDDIDLSLHFHPSTINIVNTGNMNGLNTVKFHFHGKTAHAGGSPHDGRSALDAVELMSSGANYLREHVTTDVRIHYVITDGGTAPNIVPDYASVWYYVRAPKRDKIEEVYERLIKVAKGAAMMTETEVEVEYLGGCYNTLNNHVLSEVLHEAMVETPHDGYTKEELEYAKEVNSTSIDKLKPTIERFKQILEDEKYWENNSERTFNIDENTQIFEGALPILDNDGFGSTDVGDVQHIAPGATLNTACYPLGSVGHSWQVVTASGSSIGQKGMIYAGKTLALAGLKILNDTSIVDRAKEEFKNVMGDSKYICPITDDLEIPK